MMLLLFSRTAKTLPGRMISQHRYTRPTRLEIDCISMKYHGESRDGEIAKLLLVDTTLIKPGNTRGLDKADPAIDRYTLHRRGRSTAHDVFGDTLDIGLAHVIHNGCNLRIHADASSEQCHVGLRMAINVAEVGLQVATQAFPWLKTWVGLRLVEELLRRIPYDCYIKVVFGGKVVVEEPLRDIRHSGDVVNGNLFIGPMSE